MPLSTHSQEATSRKWKAHHMHSSSKYSGSKSPGSRTSRGPLTLNCNPEPTCSTPVRMCPVVVPSIKWWPLHMHLVRVLAIDPKSWNITTQQRYAYNMIGMACTAPKWNEYSIKDNPEWESHLGMDIMIGWYMIGHENSADLEEMVSGWWYQIGTNDQTNGIMITSSWSDHQILGPWE